jgi:chromosome segregation ATPase
MTLALPLADQEGDTHMDTSDPWLQLEGLLVQLTGDLAERRAKIRRLQEALDATRTELRRTARDLRRLRAAGREDAREWATAQVQHVEVLETIYGQLRELVALHLVFRDLARLLREKTDVHEVRIRGIEARLFGPRDSSVH